MASAVKCSIWAHLLPVATGIQSSTMETDTQHFSEPQFERYDVNAVPLNMECQNKF